jgi:hypothetical protein
MLLRYVKWLWHPGLINLHRKFLSAGISELNLSSSQRAGKWHSFAGLGSGREARPGYVLTPY